MRMTRIVSFSSGHRYWKNDLTEEENRALFGKWASPYNHGHNYLLEVTTAGEVDVRTGMVVNIKRVDDQLKKLIVGRFDQRSINDEVAEFAGLTPSLEHLLLFFGETLAVPGALPPEVSLVHLKLIETPTLYAELDLKAMQLTLTRSYEFSAAHRLYAPLLEPAENDRLYGKCSNPAGHGHNYVLEVTVTGDPNPITGMMVDLNALDEAVHREVVDRYDHRHLNEDIPEFRGKIASSEIVVEEIYRRLENTLPATLSRIRLFETPRNAFEISAPQ